MMEVKEQKTKGKRKERKKALPSKSVWKYVARGGNKREQEVSRWEWRRGSNVCP